MPATILQRCRLDPWSGNGPRATFSSRSIGSLCYHERFERFSDRLADLVTHSRAAVEDPTQGTRVLSMASAGRFAVELSTSRDGQTYIERITGDRIDTYLERDAKHDFVDYGQYGWNHVKQACGD